MVADLTTMEPQEQFTAWVTGQSFIRISTGTPLIVTQPVSKTVGFLQNKKFFIFLVSHELCYSVLLI